MAQPKPDITKLPKWAQERIKTLETNLEYVKTKLRAGPENSNVFADPYGETGRPLGRDTTIRFKPTEDSHAYIDVRPDTDHRKRTFLRIQASKAIQVSPQASNVIHVRLER